MSVGVKKKISAFLAALTAVLLLAILCGCNKNPEPQNRIYYQYFDTVCVIYDYSGDPEFAARCDEIEQIIKKYDRLLDIYDEYEGEMNLATLNNHAGQGSIRVSAELAEFLSYAKQMYALSDGELNVAMGAVLSIWHEYRTAGTELPSEQELAEAAEHIDFDDVTVDVENRTVAIADPELSLDGGALAKGYVAARIREYLEDRELGGYVLDLGGNLCAVGTKPDGSGWSTGVKSPTAYGEYVYRFTLSDASAVTSGSYERYYTVDGVRYHHIIDKDTLMPARGFSSVTVITEDDALADALSTTLFCMSYEEGCRLLDTLDGVSAVWLTEEGEVLKFGID